MRLLRLEIKRVLKTPLTWILLLLALLLSVILAYIPTTFTPVSYIDESGESVILNGLEAINYIKEVQKDTAGVVTPEKMRKAVEIYQSCLRDYNLEDTYELPEGVYTKRILPISPLLHGITEAFSDPNTGIAPSIMEIDPEKVEEFYSACPERLTALMEMEQKDYPEAQRNAAEMYSKVQRPFTFYPGGILDAMDYQAMLIFLIALFCTVIAASVFSADYQTEADDILRCTKYGRNPLGITKIISALGICGVSFALCLCIYSLVSNSLFGWECTKTSIQMMASVSSLPAFNMGQLQWYVALAGGMSFFATISFTLFISSRCKSTVASLSISLLAVILPIIIYFIIPGQIGTWIRCILPAGGIGLQNSYLYALLDFEFLNIGNFAIWTPYAMLVMAMIEIPVFIGLAILYHSRHRIK